MERYFLLFVFFTSGFAALLYQTIWQRMLALFGGADVYSVTIITSVFMAGLGFGHMAGGHLADRLSLRGRILAFALAECAVGLFAALSPWIFYDVLYARLSGLGLSRAAMGGVVFVVTLWPTFFMGASLPLVSRILSSDSQHPARWIPLLYGWNAIGAATGAAAAVLWLLPALDMRTSLRIGAALSIACGLSALILAPRLVRPIERHPGTDSEAGQTLAPPAEKTRVRFPHWLLLYTLSGFIALSLEIVWFRLLGIIMKSNSLTFGYLLAMYLFGLGVGSLVAIRLVRTRAHAVSVFLLLQCAIPLVAAGVVTLFVAAVASVGLGESLWTFMADTNHILPRDLSLPMLLVVYGLVPGALILPCTMMMGLSFGILQRATQTDLGRIGRRLGWLQTANIVGSAAGALVTGLWLIEWFGTAGVLRLLAGCGVVFLLAYAWLVPGVRKLQSLALIGVLVIVVVAIPTNQELWAKIHGAPPGRTIAAEDGSGFVLLRTSEDQGRTEVFVGGMSQSWLPYGGVHTALGALPSLVHPDPRDIAVIGLASGDTAYAAGGRRETRAIHVLEIVRPQWEALGRLNQSRAYPALHMLMTDGRVQSIFADGRAFLRRTSSRYDIIEADALLPTHAGSGNLYSLEYFELLRERLKPGGLAVTWLPTDRTRATFLRVFPHVVVAHDVALGSLQPIAFSREAVLDRLNEAFTVAYYEQGQVNVRRALSRVLDGKIQVFGPDAERSGYTDINRDLDPRDEFRSPYEE
jgi:spermidine synthase